MKLLRIRVSTSPISTTAPIADLKKKATGVASIKVPDDFDPTKYSFAVESYQLYENILIPGAEGHLPSVSGGSKPIGPETKLRRRGRPPKGQPTWLDLVKQVMGNKKMTSADIRDALASHGANSKTIAQIMTKNCKGRNAAFRRVGRGTYKVLR